MKKESLLVLFLLLVLCMQPVEAAQPDQAALSEADEPVTVIESNDQQVILSFNSPDFVIGRISYDQLDYDQVILYDASITQARSGYQVPAIHALLGVPPGVEIRLQILDDSVEYLEGIYHLAPAEVPVPILTELQPGRYTVPDDPELEPGIYPASPVALVDDAWLRDQHIIKVAFHPFQYDNRSGELIHHPQIRVAVDWGGSAENEITSNIEDQESSPFESYLQNHLLNYEQARSWRTYPDQSSRVEAISQPLPEPPVQSGQTGYKIPVTGDGLYRLTYETLRDAGVPVEGLDLTTNHFHISNQGQEVATYLQKSGSTFSPGDFLLFYGQELDGTYLAETYYAEEDQHWRTYSSQDIDGSSITWQPEFNAEMIEKYTDENIYWLTIDDLDGLDIALESNGSTEPPVPPIVDTYSATVRSEGSNIWSTLHFTGEDTWFWERMSTNQIWIFPTSLTAVSPGEYSAVITGEIIAEATDPDSSPDHLLTLYLNDSEKANPINELSWDGKSRMPFSVPITQQLLVEGENQLIVEVQQAASNLLFDWFEIEYQRSFQAVDNRIFFTGEQSGEWKYVVGGFVGVTADDLWVVNIADPLQPVIYLQVPYSQVDNQGQIEFTVTHGLNTGFFAGIVSDIDPSRISSYQPVDFVQEVDHIIITHSELISSAETLAAYRTNKGISSAVYDFEDITNQYNFGIYHPIAVKNFLKYAYQSWSVKPTYALLIGDGHWNFKANPTYNSPKLYMPPNLAWVDPWQGEVDSANQLATVSGDDQLADLMIGRLLVNSPAELNTVIEKIKSFEGSEVQPWQRHFLYVTDDTPDDAGDFVESAESIIAEFIHPGNIADRVYLNDYNDSGMSITEALVKQINSDSALFVNYFGHAGIDLWAAEKIFSNEDITRLTNAGKFPIFLSSTCLDGYWIHPGKADDPEGKESLIEELVRSNHRGAVAAFSATGLGVSTGHDTLQDGFYEAVFYDGANRLGEASMTAKLRLYEAGSHLDLLQTYTVFGDPALKIQLQEIDYLLYLPFAVRE